MIVRELHVFDFDATLFDSPMHPDDWEGDIGTWYDTVQSLTPPCVIEPAALWIKSTVAAARRSRSTPGVYVVLMTGRSAEPELAARVTELVQSAGLDFDEIHLKTGGKTVDWKSQMLNGLIQEFPDLEVVQIWDDRGHHLKQFVKLVEDAGLVAIPHFVDYVLHEPCVLEGTLREYVRGVLSEYSSPDAPDGRKMWYINAHWWEQPLERVVDSLFGDSPYTIFARDLDRVFEWFHISSSWIGDDVGTVMEPRVPRHPYEDEDGRVIEDDFDPRISLAPTIDKALHALGSPPTGHIYAVDIKDKSGDEIETRVPFGSHCPSSPNNEYGKDFNWEKYARHSGVDPDDDLHREPAVINCVPDQQVTQEVWHRSELWMVYVGKIGPDRQVRLSWDFIRWYGEMTGRLDRDYIVPRMVLNPIRELEEDEKQRIEDITRAMGKPKEAYPGYDPAEELDESAVREYIRGLLTEKEIRGQKKKKRTLYHAGQRPAAPKPKARWFDREQADEEWTRHWLDSPVKSGVFLTPNPVDIAQFHGVSGNVYAYKVPEWVIEKSGGIHRYDKGSEILIPEDVWEEAGDEIEFLGKSMSQQELWDKIDWSLHMSRGRQGNPQKPGWMSTEEWKQDQAREASGNYIDGLRATKHLENAVKMMTPKERAEALEAFEQAKARVRGSSWPDWVKSQMDDWDRPRTKKDLEVMAVLKKYLNESVVRSYVRALLTEAAMGPADLPDSVGVAYSQQSQGMAITVMYYHMEEGLPLSGGPLLGIRGRVLKSPGLPYGNVSIGEHDPGPADVGECSGALMVWGSSAAHGWGPMLYDVAMELATIQAGGLMSDRDSVSGTARKVWDYYAANRGDVTGIQMDDLENTLTPEEEDNCAQNVATYSTGYPSANTTDWTKSPLSKRWTKPPTTMDALKAAGKLVEL